MKIRYVGLAAVAAASLAGTVMAGTMQGISTNQGGGLYSTYGGAYAHKFWSASDASMLPFTGGATSQGNASVVYGFCTDGNYLNQNVSGTYHLIDVTQAPRYTGGNNGPNLYTAAQRTALNAVAIAAYNMGIIDSRGFLSAAYSSGNELHGGISEADWALGLQWEIWGILGLESGVIGPTAARTALQAAAVAHINDPIRVRILGVSLPDGSTGGDQGQDLLAMIPLPPAAYAGLGTLAGLLGLAQLRRRKFAAA